MKNFRILNIFLCFLAIALAVGGIFLMCEHVARENKYALELERAVSAAANPNNHELEEAEEEAAEINEELTANRDEIAKLQEDIAKTNEASAKLQKKYDERALEVDAEYYYSIIDSLSEGVSVVETYLDDRN